MAAFSDFNPTIPSSWLDHPLVFLPVNTFGEHQPERYLLRVPKSGIDAASGYQSSGASILSMELLWILVAPVFLLSCCVFPIIFWLANRQEVPDDEQHPKMEIDEETPGVLRQKILKSIALNKSCLVIEESHLPLKTGNTVSTLPPSPPSESGSSNIGSHLHLDAPKHDNVPHSRPPSADGGKEMPTEVSSPGYDLEAGAGGAMTPEHETIHDRAAAAADDDNHDSVLYLPSRATTHTAVVSNVCAICLEPYRVGDTVISSSSTSSGCGSGSSSGSSSSGSTTVALRCSHVFHTDCFVDYAVIKVKGRGGTPIPCPTCRQGFMDVTKDQDLQPSMEDK